MKNKLTVLFLALALIISAVPTLALAQEQTEHISLYVSANGDDSGDGSITAPFATLQRARDRIREIKKESGLPTGGICVYLREGTYNLSESFHLTAEDSGTEESPITYRAYPDENVVVLGGTKINGSDFQKITDANVKKKLIDSSAADKIYQLDLSKYGITAEKVPHKGVFQFAIQSKPNYDIETVTGRAMELFVNNEAKTVSRWPNSDEMVTFEMEDVVNPNECIVSEHAKIKYKNDRIKNWMQEKDYHLYGFWTRQWADWSLEIASYDGTTMELNTPFAYPIEEGTRSWYAYNLFCELDAPGEYYMDRETNMLYYYPEENLKTADIYISVFPEALIKMECDYVNIKDLKLTASRGQGVQILGNNCKIEKCEIFNTAYQGVEIEGYGNGVVSSYLHDVNIGVFLSGGDRKTLTPGNNYVENCEITKFCRITIPTTPAVRIEGVANRVSRCKIHDAEQIALMFYGNDHLIEYNNIYNVCQKADDAAAVYSGLNLSYRGNRVENNWIHDISAGIGLMGCSGLYLDDQMCSASVKNNVFENIVGRGIQIEGGRHHVVEDNIMINCSKALVLNNRKTGVDYTNMDPSHSDYWAKQSILDMPYNTGIWAEKYPELSNILDPEEDMGAPRYNTVKNNILINSGDMQIYSVAEQYGTIENNLSYKRKADLFQTDTEGVYAVDSSKSDVEFPVINVNNTGVYTGDFYKAIDKNILLSVNSAGAIADGQLKLIDSENISAVPFIENGRTLIPIRFVAENLGAEVSWNSDEQRVDIINGENTISMVIGSNLVTINGESVETDAAAKIMDGRTYVPVRVVSEAFKKNVFWDDRGLIIIGDSEPEFSDVSKDMVISELLRQMDLR